MGELPYRIIFTMQILYILARILQPRLHGLSEIVQIRDRNTGTVQKGFEQPLVRVVTDFHQVFPNSHFVVVTNIDLVSVLECLSGSIPRFPRNLMIHCSIQRLRQSNKVLQGVAESIERAGITIRMLELR